MAITKEELIKKLNIDLSKEYAAAIQYVQHSGVLTGAAYGNIQKELIVHANEELGHAVVLADQIDYLGGVPIAEADETHTSKDNDEMLQQDLDGELDAVSRYTARIKEAESLNLLDLAQKLREILAVEQEHAMDLSNALGK